MFLSAIPELSKLFLIHHVLLGYGIADYSTSRMRAKTHNDDPDLIVGHGHAGVIAAETQESDTLNRDAGMPRKIDSRHGSVRYGCTLQGTEDRVNVWYYGMA